MGLQTDLLNLAIAGAVGGGLMYWWYTRAPFREGGHSFSENTSRSARGHDNGGVRVGLAALAVGLVTAYTLTYLIALTGSYSVLTLLELVFWVWLGFAAVVMFGDVLSGKRSWGRLSADIAFYLATWVMVGLVIVYLPKVF